MTKPEDGGRGVWPRGGLRWGRAPAPEQPPSPGSDPAVGTEELRRGNEPTAAAAESSPTPGARPPGAEGQEPAVSPEGAPPGAEGQEPVAGGVVAAPVPPTAADQPEARPESRPRYGRPDVTVESVGTLGLSANVWSLLPTPPTPPGAPVAVTRELGVYRPVDRAIFSSVFTTDIVIHKEDGSVDFVVQRDYGYPSGPLPGDPGRIPPYVDARTAVCWSLSPGAAYRCMSGGGYF